MTAAVRTHRVRANHREWTPPELISFDTETSAAGGPDGEEHVMRCWSARLDVRRARNPDHRGTVRSHGVTAAGLAAQIDEWCQGTRTVWAYAHNLSFDLAVTRLPIELAALGWTVTAHALATDSPWIRMRKGGCVLTVCDSAGWLRAPLKNIGADVGIVKPDLPDDKDTLAAWHARCDADVEILAVAMLTLMDWWDREHLGSWGLTGSSAGWNTWRHHPGTELPLIVTNEGQAAADREAIYGGRRDTWRHGFLGSGPYVSLDFRSAYPSIARDHALPVARHGRFDHLDLDSPLIDGDRYGIIAEVEIETDTPRWPVRAGGRVAYPAGRFKTTLASPEIAEARRLGCLISIGPGWLHKLGRPMSAWARWCLDAQDDDTGRTPEVAKRALKHWGRAVIGKTAQHGYKTIRYQSLGGNGWLHEHGWSMEHHAPSHLVEVAGHATESIQHGDGDNAYPAILAWVESWCRVYLARAIDAIGQANVITCDTDGLICADDCHWPEAILSADLGPLELRAKRYYRQVEIRGPQHIVTDQDRKLSGVPAKADQVAAGEYRALVWPKLATQMSLHPGADPASFKRVWQTYRMATSYITGWVLADGAVKPLAAGICPAGRTHILPWDPRDGPAPAPDLQARHVYQMITPIPGEGTPCTHHSSRPNGTDTASSPSPPIMSCVSGRKRGIRRAAAARGWLRSGVTTVTSACRAFSGWTRTS